VVAAGKAIMKSWLMGFAAGAGILVFLGGGCSVLPTTETVTRSQFTNYTQVVAAFDAIVPYRTRTTDLKALGLDPTVSPNVKVLTYVQVIQYFMPNPAITKADLHPAVRECIDAQENGHAYLVELSEIRTKRYGSAFLDIFGFKRRTLETGWRFNGLILTTNGLVVYKLSSGEPSIVNNMKRVKPLGPLQELDSAAAAIAGGVAGGVAGGSVR